MNFKFRSTCCILPVLFVVAVSACAKTKQVEEARTLHYFDIKKYFKEEAVRLSSYDEAVQKKIILNGNSETLVLDSLDYLSEFSLFLDCDINKPAWEDKYQIDTLLLQNQSSKISYSTDDQKLRTKLIEVYLKDLDVIDKIYIENKTDNLFLKTNQVLEYEPARGFYIKKDQSFAGSKPDLLELEITFLKE